MDNKFYFDTHVNNKISKKIADERKHIGFYDLVDVDVYEYVEYAKKSNKKDIVVIGIGGSALGTSAIYEFLSYTNEYDKNLHVFDTTDPLVLQRTLSKINLDDALFCIISKSGTTVETLAVTKYIMSIHTIDASNCVVITDQNSKLHHYAISQGIKAFFIPDNVGGRFSVLSAVGLVPLALIGVDIKKLLEGASSIRDSFFSNDEYCHVLLKKATYYAQKSNTYNINCLFSYSEVFREFNAWYVQLWGESLGKMQVHSEMHVGLTPVGLIGPTDQHSFLQLIVEGKRDKSVTVIKIKDFDSEYKVPDITLEHLESTDELNGLNFSTLINMQADSVIESLESLEHIPLDVIEINDVSENSIGKLIMYYEILTALVGTMMDVNTYNQPGVEMGKIILKKKLKNL